MSFVHKHFSINDFHIMSKQVHVHQIYMKGLFDVTTKIFNVLNLILYCSFQSADIHVWTMEFSLASSVNQTPSAGADFGD